MPRDLLLRVNWDLIYPPLVPSLFELVAKCQQEGADYWAISGHRSWKEQAQLYFQGRTTPGAIVTNARPGTSAHNYGLAVDFARDADVTRKGLQPSWKIEDYEVLARHARASGLESAYYWKTFREGPHVQLNLASKGLTLHRLKLAHEKHRDEERGRKAVWALLDEHGPWR